MNDAAKQWVAALRSGEYRQGKRRLAYGNQHGQRYCCLGVACHVLDPSREQWSGFSVVLPDWAREQLGLRDNSPGIYNAFLVNMNDEGLSFAEIADWIESHSKGLFK